MKKVIVLASAFVALLVQSATLDGLAAKVGYDVITIGDALNEMRRMQTGTEQEFQAAYSNAVEELVDRRLILNAAVEKKLDMQEWLVDNRVREIVKDNFNGDMNKLQVALTQSKTTLTDWRNQIRDDMIVNAMRFQMVDKTVDPSPAAMLKMFETNRSHYVSAAKTTMSVILLRPAADAKTSSVEERGKDILARLKKGESFSALAKKYSSDSHAKDGGRWVDVKPEEAFRTEIATAVKQLEPGDISELINLDGWGFIVRKDAETLAKPLTFAEAYDTIARDVKRELCAAKYKEWIARLREEAFIKIYPMPRQ